MLVFTRATMLGNPDVSMLRYEGPIPLGKVLGPYGVVTTSSSTYGAVTRAEPAAADAEAAAARAQPAASKMAQEFPSKLQKKSGRSTIAPVRSLVWDGVPGAPGT